MAAAAPIGEEPGVAKLAEQGLAQVADFFSSGIPAPWGGEDGEEGRGSWSFPDVGIPTPWGGTEEGGRDSTSSWSFPGVASLLGQGPEGPIESGRASREEPAAEASSPTSPSRGRGRGLSGPEGGLNKWHRKLAGAKGRSDGTSPKETDAQLSLASQASHTSQAPTQASISTASGYPGDQKNISSVSAYSQRSSGSAAPQIATFQPWKSAAAPAKKPLADPRPAGEAAKKPVAAPQIATFQPWKAEGKVASPTPQPVADPKIATFQPWKPTAKAEEPSVRRIATADDEASPPASPAMHVPSEPIVRIPEAAQDAPGGPEPPECTSSEQPVCATMSYPTLDDSMMLPSSLPQPKTASTSPRRAALDTCLEDPAAEEPPAPAKRSAVANANAQKPMCLLGMGLVGHVVTTGTDLDLTRPGGLPPPSGPESLDQTMPGGRPPHR